MEFIIGLDLGGSFLKYALGTPDGQVIYDDKKPSRGNESKEAIFKVIYAAINELLAEAEKRGGKIVAIGMGSPGSVDFDQGKLIGNTPNLPEWGNADIRKKLEGEFGIPTFADNDANVMVLAEAIQGAAKGYQNVIGLTLGTGIGGGILIDGKIYRGVNYAGAEIGHMSIDYKGLSCNCGGVGCIELYASATGMVRNYREKLSVANKSVPQVVNTEVIFANAKQGEQEAINTIDETCVYLGTAIASLVNIFNPEIIVIGGGVADAGDDFLKPIWNVIQERAMKPSLRGVKLVKAELGNKAGMVGAISLASQSYYNN